MSVVWSGLGIVAMIVGYAAFKLSARQHFIAKRRDLWRRFAQRHNAELVISPYFMTEQRDHLDFNLDGCALRLTHTYFSHNSSYHQTDIFTLLTPSPEHDKIAHIYAEGVASTFTKLLGAQDVELGYHDFDEHFIVKSNDPSWLSSRFNEALAREHLLFKYASVSLSAKTLKLTRSPGCTTEAELLALLRLVSMYANALLGSSQT